MRRRFVLALAPLLLAGCAGFPALDAGGDNALAKAVEPSLRQAALTAEAANDWKGATQHWRTLYQRNPGDKGVALSLARALRAAGQAQQAADLMQAELGRHGRDAGLVAELGKDYLAADRIGLALKHLEEARNLAPGDWEAHSALGVALDAATRYDDAAAAYAGALALSPDNPQVLNNLALSQALAGRLDEAVATLGRANEQPHSGPQIRQNLALLLALTGDAARAERMAAKDLPADMARANSAIYRTLAEGRR